MVVYVDTFETPCGSQPTGSWFNARRSVPPYCLVAAVGLACAAGFAVGVASATGLAAVGVASAGLVGAAVGVAAGAAQDNSTGSTKARIARTPNMHFLLPRNLILSSLSAIFSSLSAGATKLNAQY